MDTLRCPCCNSEIKWEGTKGRPDNVADFVAKLRSGHHRGCPWAHPQPIHQELVAFPTCQAEPVRQAFLDRITMLSRLESLPPISIRGLQKLLDGRLKQVLSLLDASSIPVKV